MERIRNVWCNIILSAPDQQKTLSEKDIDAIVEFLILDNDNVQLAEIKKTLASSGFKSDYNFILPELPSNTIPAKLEAPIDRRLRNVNPRPEKSIFSLVAFTLIFSMFVSLSMIILPIPFNLIMAGGFITCFIIGMRRNHRNSVRYTLAPTPDKK